MKILLPEPTSMGKIVLLGTNHMSRAGGRGEGAGVAREGGGWMGREGKKLRRNYSSTTHSMVTPLVWLPS